MKNKNKIWKQLLELVSRLFRNLSLLLVVIEFWIGLPLTIRYITSMKDMYLYLSLVMLCSLMITVVMIILKKMGKEIKYSPLKSILVDTLGVFILLCVLLCMITNIDLTAFHTLIAMLSVLFSKITKSLNRDVEDIIC